MSSEVLSISESIAGGLVLLGAYLYFYRTHRDRSLLLWSVGWGFSVVRLILSLLAVAVFSGPELTVAVQLANLLSAYHILAGTFEFAGRRLTTRCRLAFGFAALWVTAATAAGARFWIAGLPPSILMGLTMLFLGVILLRERQLGFGRSVAGVTFILWALHKVNYPFLRTVEWFAHLGFVLGGLFALVAGVALLMTYLEQLQSTARANEERFRTLVASIEDIVITASLDGRVRKAYGGWFVKNGVREHELRGLHLAEVLEHRHDTTVAVEIVRAGEGHTRHLTLDVEVAGRSRWFAFTVSPLRDSDERITGIVVVGRDITDHAESKNALATRLEENNTLLQEIHHRVKNNMQIMASLLSLQSTRLTHPADRVLIEESSRRIETMARVHEQLYASGSLSHVAMHPYITELVDSLVHSYNTTAMDIRVISDVDHVRLSIDQAVPCAQILHEVITNALKHGFRGRDHGTIRVELKADASNHVRLRIHDDGNGMRVPRTPPQDAHASAQQETLGLKLVDLLSRQLDGVGGFTNGDGTTFDLGFPRGRLDA